MNSKTSYIDRLHNLIDDEYEARACKDIDDDACQVVPGNYFLINLSLVLGKLADTFASAKIVLPWLMNSTGAPLFLISLLVPIRESGSMLPQLLLGAYIRHKPTRKKFLVWGAILQALMISGLLLVAINMSGTFAGVAIISLTILFSLARAISSIANKDVTGKTIPKKQRGRLSGSAASIAGLISIGLGIVLLYDFTDDGGVQVLLLLAAIAFTLSAISYGLIKEYPGATEGAVNAVEVAIKNISLFKKDKDFARFVLVRALMISSGLAAPYFVLMTQSPSDDKNLSEGLGALGLFIILSGIASFISGSIWGRLADHNSKGLISLTALLNTIICLAAATALITGVEGPITGLGLFFALSIVHEGVRQGRKTYLIDMAGVA